MALATLCAATATAAVAQSAPAAAGLPEEAKARSAALQHRQEQRAAERRDIAHERAALAERQKPLEAACYQKFAVEDCLRQVRNEARVHEKPLRERELRLNDAERREKSSERLRGIEQKMSEPRTPPVMQATPRQPLTQPGRAPQRTEADVERDRATRDTDAQQRAQSQAYRAQSKQQQQGAQVQAEAERRSKAQQATQQRQEEAAKAKVRRDKAMSEAKKVAPLPAPSTP